MARSLETGDLAAAEGELRDLLANWRGDPLTLSLHARLLLKKGFTQAASKLLEIAAAADTDNVLLLEYSAWAAYECQDLRLSKATFERIRALEGRGRADLGLGLIALDEGRLGAAKSILSGVSTDEGNEFCVAFWLGLVDAALSEFDSAANFLRRAVELQPECHFAKFYLALVDAKAERIPCSREWLAEALRELPPYLTMQWIDSFEFLKSVGCEETLAWGSRGRNIRSALHATSVSGWNAEFGVRNGASINIIADEDAGPAVGFDTFEGLTESWRDVPRGAYSTYGRIPRVPSNVLLVQGRFSETVRSWLSSTKPVIKFVHFDCDTCESTLSAFAAIDPHLPKGAVILFDQYVMNDGWTQDEHKALNSWLKLTGRRVSYLFGSLITRQVAVRLE